MDILLIDRHPTSDFICCGDRPVWPVRASGEMETLGRVAAVFGATLNVVRGEVRGLARGQQRVVGIGEPTRMAVELYGHLTQRVPVVIAGENALSRLARVAVVIALYRDLTATLLHRMNEMAEDEMPGLILADTLDQLHLQVLAKSASASLCGPIHRRRVDLYPMVPLSVRQEKGRVRLGWRSSARSMRSALEKPCGVLTLDTHSDGVDAFLGANLTFCPLDRKSREVTADRQPYCVATGVCYRQHLPIQEAWRARRLVSPGVVSARVLVLNVCRGLLLPKGGIDPKWGLATRLLEANSVGAILLSWEMTLPQQISDSVLSDDLAAGMPVGRAARGAMVSPRAARFSDRICLLGDPRTRAAPPAGSISAPLASRTRRVLRSGPQPGDGRAHSRFLRKCLKIGCEIDISGRSRLARAALAELNRYELHGRKGHALEGASDTAGPRFRCALLRYLVRRGELFEDWAGLAQIEGATRRGRCAHCGQPLRTYGICFGRRRFPGRILETCPHCEITKDAPRRSGLALSVDDGRTIRLHGTLPRNGWSAGLLLSSWREDRVYLWPPRLDGAPVAEFQPPGGLPARHVYVVVFFVWKTEVTMLRVSTYGQGDVETYLKTESESALTEVPNPAAKGGE